MTRSRKASIAAGMAATLAALIVPAPSAQGPRAPGRAATFAAGSLQDLRQWDPIAESMLRSGELRVRQVREDTQLPGRRVERADQYYRGVRVFGADISRQLDHQGVVLSMFGHIYGGIDISSNPAITPEAVKATVTELAGLEQAGDNEPELVVLPIDDGDTFRLAWRMRGVTDRVDIVQYFLDAQSGALLRQYSDRQTQSVVGRGTGVLGDSKKISVSGASGNFTARDLLRPPLVETDDMKGDPTRTLNYLDGRLAQNATDVAADADNTWTDGAVTDAHVYAGYTYDYYFKRFGRRGLDNNNIRIRSLVNPVRRTAQDVSQYFNLFPDFFVNAFYAGGGVMVYGVGLPQGFTLGGQTWNHFSGALDIVAHEITHGVTDFTSDLIYRNESGALNEAFSDIIGTSVEFFFQPAGSGDLRADYLCGEDIARPGGLRSMENPQLHGDPDHYSRRFLGTQDNGGVHINSGIANHAFYLAVEGGTNRTSGLGVQGVGAANREQIERVFYRAFTQMLPANATFSLARAATIQAARDLFGANSNAERAVTQAWTAVGVN
ncbi:MAG TPA: M4 family metallopeptidase [Vicinamibacterales bacterium]|nr:M4 family metallopeptidase [Vicinamibacterales bacterium]